MPDLTKEQAETLAGIVVPAIREHAQSFLDSLDDEDKREMHPQALAALGTLSGIQGTFCEVAPKIDEAINSLGWIAKMFLGSAYALLLTFQTVLKAIAAPLCGTPAEPAKPKLSTNVKQSR